MDKSNKRIVAIVVTNRTPYGRLKPVMRAIERHPQLSLRVIVGIPVSMRHMFSALRNGQFSSWKTALSTYFRARIKTILYRGDFSRYELLSKLIKKDGFEISGYLPMFLDGGSLITMTRIQGNVLHELPQILLNIKPDILLVHADRFEMLPVALSGVMLNIPVAHTQGGDVSGTIDESIRHAITKLAHIHFPTTENSKQRIIQMGEDSARVYMVGCPTIDTLTELDLGIDADIYARNGQGYGERIRLNEPFVLLMQHPVTTEYAKSMQNMQQLLTAIRAVGLPVLMFWPNIDGGTDGASEAVREFLEQPGVPGLTLYKTFNTEDFYRVLNAAAVAVGNSSSFIREASYLGTPAVIVGTRQQERERAENVVESSYDTADIESKIKSQLKHGRYAKSSMYGDGNASGRIADILATVEIESTQKRFNTRPSDTNR